MSMVPGEKGATHYLKLFWRHKQSVLMLAVLVGVILNRHTILANYHAHRQASYAVAVAALVAVLIDLSFLQMTKKYLPGIPAHLKIRPSWNDRYRPFLLGLEITLIISFLLDRYTGFYTGILPTLRWSSLIWALLSFAGIGWFAKQLSKSHRRTQSVESFARGIAVSETVYVLISKLFEHDALATNGSAVRFGVMSVAMLALAWAASDLYDSETARHETRVALREGKLQERRHTDTLPEDEVDRRLPEEMEDDVHEDLGDTQATEHSALDDVDMSQPISNEVERRKLLAIYQITEEKLVEVLAHDDLTLDEVGERPLAALKAGLEKLTGRSVL